MSKVKLFSGELSRWLQTRKFGSIPNLDSLPTFATQWVAWWNALQPKWRLARESGGLSLAIMPCKSHPLPGIRKGGPNGVVTILISLKWWRHIEDPDWMMAINDVKSCLERCLAGQKCYVLFHSSDSDPIPGLILGSVICHCYYISCNYSLSFYITSLCYLFTLVSDRKPDNRLFLVFKLSYFHL